jgi:hypothetical protein
MGGEGVLKNKKIYLLHFPPPCAHVRMRGPAAQPRSREWKKKWGGREEKKWEGTITAGRADDVGVE